MHNRNKTSRGQQQPLISLTIELGNNKSDRIALFRHTDPYIEAKQFVQRNHLSQQMVQVITNSIIKQMKAYDEMMLITYDTQSEITHLKSLKQNHIELQQRLKTPSPNRLKQSPSNVRKLELSRSRSPTNSFDDLPTDKVIIKRLFQLLDSDQDGLISANKVSYNKIPTQLKNKISGFLSSSMVPFEFEELYSILKEDPQEDQIFDIPKIKVLL